MKCNFCSYSNKDSLEIIRHVLVDHPDTVSARLFRDAIENADKLKDVNDRKHED